LGAGRAGRNADRCVFLQQVVSALGAAAKCSMRCAHGVIDPEGSEGEGESGVLAPNNNTARCCQYRTCHSPRQRRAPAGQARSQPGAAKRLNLEFVGRCSATRFAKYSQRHTEYRAPRGQLAVYSLQFRSDVRSRARQPPRSARPKPPAFKKSRRFMRFPSVMPDLPREDGDLDALLFRRPVELFCYLKPGTENAVGRGRIPEYVENSSSRQDGTNRFQGKSRAPQVCGEGKGLKRDLAESVEAACQSGRQKTA